MTAGRVRALLAGLVCATGAMAAHATAGGEVTAAAALLAIVLSAALAPLLLDRVVDPARTLALSLVAQVVWHAAFMTTAALADTPMHHGSTSSMVLHHGLAAVLAAGVAVGLERSLVGALDWLVGVALPTLVRLVALPAPLRPAPAYAALARVPDDAPHDPARPLRAPPRCSLPG